SGFAASLARRAGEERVLFGASIAMVAGLLARGAAPGALLFPGTIVCSGAIAVMNVLLSSLIKRRWPERAGFLIGLYITALSAGAIVASLVSVPLSQDTGGPGRPGGAAVAAAGDGRVAAAGYGGRSRHRRCPPGSRGGAQARDRLARDDLHGHAVAAVLRDALLAADDAARPGGERRGGRRASLPEWGGQPGGCSRQH